MAPLTPTVPVGVKLTGLLNVPLKITPLGMPLEPLPVIVNVPPEANTAPVWKFPEVSAPVVKVNEPSPPWTRPSTFKPPISVTSEPERVSPDELPARVPPLLVKSTLFAKAAKGKAKARSAIKTIRFIIRSSENLGSVFFVFRKLTLPLTGDTCSPVCLKSKQGAKLEQNVTL